MKTESSRAIEVEGTYTSKAEQSMRSRRNKKSNKYLISLSFDSLEQRLVLDSTVGGRLNEISSVYRAGFNPTDLYLNGSAKLAGTTLRLTDGGRDQAGSAYHTIPVKTTEGFTTSFEFQFASNGVDPLGSGFAFVIQNGTGYAALDTANLDKLGIPWTPHLAIKFGTHSPGVLTNDPLNTMERAYSDNSTGIYLGLRTPNFLDSSEIYIPKEIIDLHSGNRFRADLTYRPPTGSSTGSLDETLTDLSTQRSWSHSYENVDLQSILKRIDVDGSTAYAGFAASTGSPDNPRSNYTYTFGKGASTQDVLSWTWSSASTSPGDPPFKAAFQIDAASSTSAAVYDSSSRLVRTLWQATTLQTGSHVAYWDGRDQYGSLVDAAAAPGPYEMRVVQDAAVTNTHVMGNDTLDSTNWAASISSISMNGVTVSPDGSKIWAATTNGDTAGGGFVKVFDAIGQVDTTDSGYYGFQQIGEAVAYDAGSLYIVAEVQSWSGEFGIFKVDLTTHDYTTGFTNVGRTNADGSEVRTLGGYLSYLSILRLRDEDGYHFLPGIAVDHPDDRDHGSLWVTDVRENLIRRYDKVTGNQVGVPISVVHPTGIAVDASGSIWVAHGTAIDPRSRIISIYDSAGRFVRDVTEIDSLIDVLSMQINGNKLVVADNGAGHAAVFTIEESRIVDGEHPILIGRPASFGDDDGRTTFWNLRGASIDDAGNVYTVQITNAPGSIKGTQLAKWSPSGKSLWVRGGYEYQSVGGMYSASDPTTVISSSLHRYKVDPATGDWEYSGSAVYPGFDTNPWSGLPNASPASPPRVVTLGNVDFYAIPTWSGNRLIFFRLGSDGSFHPSTIVGSAGLQSGNAWTWNDGAGDGIPLDSQIKDSGTKPGHLVHIFADAQGNIWYQEDWHSINKIPLKGLDSRGNPIYDWTQSVRVVDAPSGIIGFEAGSDGIYVIYHDESIGPLTSDSVIADYSSGGANALCKFDLRGRLVWRIPLPEPATSVDVIPGGGAIIGSLRSRLYRVDGNGQLVGSIESATPGDMLDFGGGTINVNRNPNDGLLDVFAEGIAYSDTPWYRIDDRNPGAMLLGTLAQGQTVILERSSALPTNSVNSSEFIGETRSQRGDWAPTFGSEGYHLAQGPSGLPGYASVAFDGTNQWTWAAVTADERALKKVDEIDRLAACWYSTQSFTVDVSFSDGLMHDVSLYAIDWDHGGRRERIDVVDPNTGEVLETRTIAMFSDGVYLSFRVQGHVQLRISSLSGPNAVLSAIFFGSFVAPQSVNSAKFVGSDRTSAGDWSTAYGTEGYALAQTPETLANSQVISLNGANRWTWAADTTDTRALQTSGGTERSAAVWYASQSFTINLSLPDANLHKVSLYVVDWDDQGRSERIDVVDASSGQVLESRTVSDFSDGVYLTWELQGNLQLRITSLSGPNAVVSGFFVGGSPTMETVASAAFVGADKTVQGNWTNVFGKEGVLLPTGNFQPNDYANVSLSNERPWTWESTTNRRALYNPASSDRTASCWYSTDAITIDVDLTDGRTHLVSIYAIDWDNQGRSERIEIRDVITGKLLDSRSIDSFSDGEYLSWRLQGHIQIQITRTNGPNAVVSGLFFDDLV